MSADLLFSRHYVISLQRERLREQLLQQYKAQRHAVPFKTTLSIEDKKLFKACRSVHLFARAITSEVPPPKV